MRVFTTLDEVSAAVGEELGSSDWLTIDQERVNVFADATGDHQWIHVDVERVPGRTVRRHHKNGYLTLSLVPFLGSQVLQFETPGAKLNYGTNKVRFPNPVLVGKRIRAHVALSNVADLPEGQAGPRCATRSRSRARPSRPASPRPSYSSSPERSSPNS